MAEKKKKVVRMFENRLAPHEIPKKLDPRPTKEIIETLIDEVEKDEQQNIRWSARREGLIEMK